MYPHPPPTNQPTNQPTETGFQTVCVLLSPEGRQVGWGEGVKSQKKMLNWCCAANKKNTIKSPLSKTSQEKTCLDCHQASKQIQFLIKYLGVLLRLVESFCQTKFTSKNTFVWELSIRKVLMGGHIAQQRNLISDGVLLSPENTALESSVLCSSTTPEKPNQNHCFTPVSFYVLCCWVFCLVW